MAVWRGAGPREDNGGGAFAGLAVFVPDLERAGQADELAPAGEPLLVTNSRSRKLERGLI